jgi:hypothetical protein
MTEVSSIYDPNGATPQKSPYAAPAVAAKAATIPDFTEASGGTPLKVPGAAIPVEAAVPPGGGEIAPAVPAPTMEAIPISNKDLPKAPTPGAVKASASAKASPLNEIAPESPDQTKQQYTQAQARAAKKGETFWGYDQGGNRVLYRKQ